MLYVFCFCCCTCTPSTHTQTSDHFAKLLEEVGSYHDAKLEQGAVLLDIDIDVTIQAARDVDDVVRSVSGASAVGHTRIGSE